MTPAKRLSPRTLGRPRTSIIDRASICDVRRPVRPPTRNGSRHRPRPHRTRGGRGAERELAIVVHGGVVQGVYANRCGPLTVYRLDYDDLRADEGLAAEVARSGEVPQIPLAAGLGRAVAAYRGVAIGQARRRAAEPR